MNPVTGAGGYSITHTYDPAGNRTQMNDNGTVTTFTYTPANRLTLATTGGTLVTYTHDAAGNRTAMTAMLSGSPYTTYYTWDATGAMTVAEPSTGTVTFTYNAEGQRAIKDSGGSVTAFLYDYKKLLAETDDVGGLVSSLYTTTTDQEYGDLIDEDGGAATHLYDAQANTNALLDASGDVLAQYKYYAFGNIASFSVDGAPWTQLDTSQWSNMTSDQWTDLTPAEGSINMLAGGQKQYYLDQETSFYLLGMGNNQGTYNDPATTRRVNEDPIRQASGDDNLFIPTRNNPVNTLDPSGHDIDEDHRKQQKWYSYIKDYPQTRFLPPSAVRESEVWEHAKEEVFKQYGLPPTTPWNTVTSHHRFWFDTTYGDLVKSAYQNELRNVLFIEEFHTRVLTDADFDAMEKEAQARSIPLKPGSDSKLEASFNNRLRNALFGDNPEKAFDDDAQLAIDVLMGLRGSIPSEGINWQKLFNDPKIRLAINQTSGGAGVDMDRFNSYLQDQRQIEGRKDREDKVTPEDIDQIIKSYKQSGSHLSYGTRKGLERIVQGLTIFALGSGPKPDPLPESLPVEGLPVAAEGAAEAPKAIKPTAADYLNPKPNTLYESNGYNYQMDANGKLTEVSGDLRLGKGARNSYQQAKVGRSSGVAGDEGGHMAGAQFDALGEGPLHLVPQAMKLNRGAGSAWSAMEREWADAVSSGNKVSFKTNIDWPAGASRPTKFRVQYTVTSPSGTAQTFVRTFLNQ